MVNKSAKILLIEDNPGDVRLIREMLTEVPDVSFELETASRLSTGLKRLDKEKPDVILLDIGLPDSQGIDTLKRVYAKVKTLPIVVLTGLEDESVGMEAVHRGAQDYLVKGRVDGKVLWRVINYSVERKSLENYLEKERQEYKRIIDSSPIIIFYKNKEGRFLRVNRAFAETLRMPEEEFIGKTVFDLYSTKIARNMAEDDKEVFESGRPKLNVMEQYESASGLRWAQTDKIPIFDEGGVTVGLIGFAQDITERKQAEEALRQSEERYRTLFNSKLDGMCVMDETMKVLLVNQAAVDIFGFDSIDEALGANPFDFIPLEERDRVLNVIKEDMFKSDLRQVNEFRLTNQSGKNIWVSAVGTLTEYEGKLAGLISFRDVTERKEAEEAVRQSEEKYRTILEQMEEGYFETDVRGNFTVVNDATCRVLGYSREEMIGTSYRAFVTEEYADAVYQTFNQVYVTGTPVRQFPYEAITKDGGKRFVEVSVLPLRDKEGRIIGFRGIGHDITERKQAEEKLRKAEELYRLLAENVTDIIFAVDMNLKPIYFSPSAEIILGYTSEEAMTEKLEAGVTGESVDVITRLFADVLATIETGTIDPQKVWSAEIEVVHKDGHRVPVEARAKLLLDPAGTPLGIVGVMRDITERKRMERELRSSRDHLDRILNSMVEVLMVMDTDYNIIDVNRSFLQYYGGKREDIIGRKCYKVMHGISKPCATAKRHCPLKTVLKTGKPVTGEGDYKTAEGQEFIFEESMFSLVDADGNIEAVVEMQHDITVRKNMEESLRISEQNFRDSIENSLLGIRVIDKDGKTIYANQALLDMWGYGSIKELEAVPANQRYTPESYPGHMKRMKDGKVGESIPPSYEVSIIRSDGQVRHVSASTRALVWGGEMQYQAVYQDVTERKQAETEYRTIIRTAMDGFCLTDMKGHFLDVNEAYCDLTGYSRDELLNMSVKDVEAAEKPEDVAERIRKVERVGYDSFESRHRHKDGRIIDVEISVNYLPAGGGRMFIFVRDITERKRMEEELKKSVEKFKKTMEGVIQVIASIVEVRDPYTAGHQRRVADLACAIAKEMGLSQERVEEIHMAALIHDIGKIYVPAEILSKPSTLTEIEFSMIKSHPQVAYDILKSVEFPWPICKVVLQHHERMNSSGYPGGLPGEDITFGARILAVADVVEAMASHRPYRPALGIDKALEEISKNKGILYDTGVADACLRLFNEKEFKFE
jgi:PAS domain S-box-containing protein/putative nucleotidyltransferase with HDIG domain